MLKPINAKVQIEMTVVEASEINALIERDKPKAIRVESDVYCCPMCGNSVLLNYAKFCYKCGQRLDRENIAFE